MPPQMQTPINHDPRRLKFKIGVTSILMMILLGWWIYNEIENAFIRKMHYAYDMEHLVLVHDELTDYFKEHQAWPDANSVLQDDSKWELIISGTDVKNVRSDFYKPQTFGFQIQFFLYPDGKIQVYSNQLRTRVE